MCGVTIFRSKYLNVIFSPHKQHIHCPVPVILWTNSAHSRKGTDKDKMWSPCAQNVTQKLLIHCNNTDEIQRARAFLATCCGCSKQGQCQRWATKGAAPQSPETLPCCTCDGNEGPCAVLKVVGFAIQEQDAAFEPALVLQGQPFHQQRGTLGQRYSACRRRGEGGRAKRKGWEKERGSEREGQHTHSQTGRVSTCRKRAYHAEDTGIQGHKGHSQSHRQNHPQSGHQLWL